MLKQTQKSAIHNIRKSKFLRSIFTQITLIFMIVVAAIIGIVFFSFTKEINKSIYAERQKQLDVIEDNISKRMEEAFSIAYNIGTDNAFYIEAMSDAKYTGYELSRTLATYLVGNDFIEYLAYYRLSEDNTVYSSKGVDSIHSFLSAFMKFDEYSEEEYVELVKQTNTIQILPPTSTEKGKAFFTYICPLPQFSKNPQAFIIMLIPYNSVKIILETQLTNCHGTVAMYDALGNYIFSVSNLNTDLPDLMVGNKVNPDINNKKYIIQECKSEENGWSYVSVIKKSDMISEIAGNQLIFIVLLLVLMIGAIILVLYCIMIQYKPINNLAASLNENNTDSNNDEIIDEKSLLSNTFATLKDDSEQKQKFEAAYYAAEAASKAKSTFLSNMSHDIRTPMNAIVGMTELAFKHVDDAHYVKECLQNVRVSSQYLLDIINNVLDMSRIESGKFTLSKDVVELPKVVCGIVTILNQSISVKSQKLVIDTNGIFNEKVIGDNVRLTQVFMNILSNSVKFTPNGGTITLIMTQEKAKDGYADYTFSFQDTGMGMTPEFTEHVFDTFTRDTKSGTPKVEGTGLGMAIAKSFVEMMGGSIKCKSELGRGTTFTIHMHMQVTEDKGYDDDNVKYQNLNVLILGNGREACLNQVALFKEIGVKVDYALNNLKAVKMITQAIKDNEPYQFVIINQCEEDKSGITAVKLLREASQDANTTYVLSAGDIMRVDQSAAVDRGMTAFIQNPLFRSSIRSILDKSMELQHNTTDICDVDMEGRRVLLVEDNSINRKIAYSLLTETKATIYEATNGKEAVDIFKEHEAGYFDVILMDVQMPVLNGYEATAAIRSIQREDALTVPIYAMTANTFDEDVRQVKEAGMNGHLGKPYVPKDLYKILLKVIELKSDK